MSAAARPAPADALTRALDARKVAVFGASSTPGKWGYVVVEQLLAQGFDGEVVLVNPRGGSAFGLPLQDAAAAAGADLAVAVTPPPTVPAIAAACGRLGIGVLSVHTAGFGEVGEHELEAELAQAARNAGVRLLGPNCLGLHAAPARLNVTTLPDLPTGRVSFVSQSGGLALQVARRLRALGAGLDVLLSLGNKLDVGFADALAAIGARETTGSVLLYLEGLGEGDVLLDRVAELSAAIPVVVVAGGRSEPGRTAARSHTGALLRSWDRAAGLLAAAGAQVLESLPLAVAAAAASRPPRRRPARSRVFALVDGGGHSVLLADALAAAGHELPPPGDGLARALGTEHARVENPLDLAGAADGDPEIYGRALAHVLEDGGYDAVLVGGIFGGYGELFGRHLAEAELRAAAEIGRLATEHGATVVVQSTYATAGAPALEAMRDRGVACVEWAEEAVAALGPHSAPPRAGPEPAADAADVRLAGDIAAVLAALDEAGIRHGLGPLVDRSALPQAGGSWVLRLDGFAHKVQTGAIRLRVPTAGLADAWDELAALARGRGIEPLVRVAPFVATRHELLVSFWRDPDEGSGYAIGSGGTDVERLADVAIGRPPRSADDVLATLERTAVGAALDAGELAELAPFVARLAATFRDRLPELRELECNPVALVDGGPIVLDVLPGR